MTGKVLHLSAAGEVPLKVRRQVTINSVIVAESGQQGIVSRPNRERYQTKALRDVRGRFRTVNCSSAENKPTEM